MNAHTLQALREELTCAICMNYFLDPVTIDCGHSFCRPCLCLCWEGAQTPKCCPMCRGVPEKLDFKTSSALRNMASHTRKTSQARADEDSSSQEQTCAEHKEAKGLFCDVDKNLLCRLCSESPEHVAHSHSPAQWAAEEYREELLKRMNSLWNTTQEMQNNVEQEASKTLSFEGYVTLRKTMVKAQYEKMHQILHEEELLHLHTIEREAKEIFQRLQESKVRMTQQTESLKEVFRELMDLCHKPEVVLLQDMGTALERTELVQEQKPQPVNPELTLWCFTGLLNLMNIFRVDNVLCQETISRCLTLSEDVRSVMFGADRHSRSRGPRRVRSYAAWGTQTFTSGRYYWEVDAPHSTNWILGVCKDSLISDTDLDIDFDEASLLFSWKMNDQYYLSTNSPHLIHFVKRPLGKIGVFLDYDKGTVSFYDTGKCSLICTLVSFSFSSPLKPFLCFEVL